MSNKNIRRAILSFGLISLSLGAFAQPRSSTLSETAAIEHAQNLLASSFDPRLPRVPLEYFLTYEAGGASGEWTVTECEKSSSDMSVTPQRNPAICVRTDYELRNGGAVTLLLGFEEPPSAQLDNTHLGGASIVRLTLTGPTGEVRQIRSLGDLPLELHRRPSKRPLSPPRDLPPPARYS